MILEIENLSDIHECEEISIIINYNTRIFSALAIASAERFISKPILIVDCFSTDDSIGFFKRLFAGSTVTIYLLKRQLETHGSALDALISGISAKYAWLVDSDLEVLQPGIVQEMRRGIGVNDNVYGAGLLQKSCWLQPPHHNYPPNTYYYLERPFVPLTLLKVEMVRRLISGGCSFVAKRHFNEVTSEKISKILAQRFKLPVLKNIRLDKNSDPDSRLPPVEEYDTAACLHLCAKNSGMDFYAIDDRFWSEILHFDGVTRSSKAGAIFKLFCKLNLIGGGQLTGLADNREKAEKRLGEYFPHFRELLL